MHRRGGSVSGRRAFLGGSAAALTLAACGRRAPGLPEPDQPADLAIVGGRVLTFDRKRPEAAALALRGGLVQAIGARADIEALVGRHTRVLDLEGGLALPGLTDAHAHLVNLGRSLAQVDLRGASSVAEVVARLKRDAPDSGWIEGRGWDQNLWDDADLHQGMPTHRALSEAFPDRPVWLQRVDGHAGWANAAAMRAGAIGPATAAPAGGELLRFVAGQAPTGAPEPEAPDDVGAPTGIFVDTAMQLVPVPPPTAAQIDAWVREGQRHVLARGITGVHEMGVSSVADGVFRSLAASEELALRITGYADRAWFERELVGGEPVPPAAEDLYALVGAKIYADGALGSRGAALLADYSDRPGHRGKLQVELEALAELATRAMGKGWQLATHAIGDRANRTVLDAYAIAFQRHRKRNHRFRIEHAQLIDDRDFARFAELSVIASMQPTHATSDMAWVPDRVGPTREAGAYAWRRLLDAGVHLCFGSDFPVERADLTHGLHAATTRQDAAGRPAGGWQPDQRLELHEAIAAFAPEAAYAARREAHLGKLAVGMQGDVTCFAEDLFELEPSGLREARVRATVVRGALRHES